MIIIGENIHIISPEVKEIIATRDTARIQHLAKMQVALGARMLDLNIGPQKKQGVEVVEWLVPAVQEAVDVPLSIDTTNLDAIRAGLALVKQKGMVNSASAEPERLEQVPLVAAEYGARLVALMMGKGGIPMTAEERVAIAIEYSHPSGGGSGHPHGRPVPGSPGDDRLGVSGVLSSRRGGRPLHQAGHGPGAHDHLRAQQRVEPGYGSESQPAQPRVPGDADGGGPRFRHRRSAGRDSAGHDPHRRRTRRLHSGRLPASHPL